MLHKRAFILDKFIIVSGFYHIFTSAMHVIVSSIPGMCLCVENLYYTLDYNNHAMAIVNIESIML